MTYESRSAATGVMCGRSQRLRGEHHHDLCCDRWPVTWRGAIVEFWPPGWLRYHPLLYDRTCSLSGRNVSGPVWRQCHCKLIAARQGTLDHTRTPLHSDSRGRQGRAAPRCRCSSRRPFLADVRVMALRPLCCLAHSSRHGCCAPLLEFLERSPPAASSSPHGLIASFHSSSLCVRRSVLWSRR